MVYVSSYESGRAPYAPDKNRGSWLHPDDFIYACISLVFQIDVISRSWLSSIESGVMIFILVYLLSTVIFIVPLMVVKSYLGQFSSSGFISALRISPIFKGMGYVSLIMNICILACNSLFATVPLLYMFASMNPTLPWSCEGFTWTRNLTEDEDTNLCNNESYATKIVSYVDGDNIAHNFTEYKMHNIPSVLYLKYMFHDAKLFYYGKFEFSMAWQLIICTLLVWAIISTMVLKGIQTQTIGTLIRYSMCIVIGLMTSFIIAFSFLPGASKVYENIFDTTHHSFMNTVAYIPICGLAAFGPGWGMVITLSSFNKFNTNVVKSSCLIALGQFGVMLGLEFLIRLSEAFLFANANDNYYRDVEVFWTLYLSSGNVLAHLPWANLWSILFYFMLFLSNLTLTFLQLLSILTSIFDEFVFLRETRVYVITGLLFFLTALSIFFTSNSGMTYIGVISTDTLITQSAVNLLLILIVLWIYGRERFQRDIEFMTTHRFATWSINILRFVAPIGLLLALYVGLFISSHEHVFSDFILDLLSLIFIAIPWLGIPGFVIYQMLRSMGTIKERFFKSCCPTDWFPIEPEDKQRYDAVQGSVDITHTLSEIKDTVVV
uniref:Transporter n=1 Tax=Stomoxys calcitrans TaxID=35570 RepID=A0A1I8PZ61_STOCA